MKFQGVKIRFFIRRACTSFNFHKNLLLYTPYIIRGSCQEAISGKFLQVKIPNKPYPKLFSLFFSRLHREKEIQVISKRHLVQIYSNKKKQYKAK